MKKVSIGEFRTEVLTDVPGCPIAVVDRAILRAAIEFCDFTLTWRQQIYSVGARLGFSTYELTTDSMEDLVAIVRVGDNGYTVEQTTEMQLDSAIDGWRDTANQSLIAKYYYQPDRNTLRLALTPGESNVYEVVAALRPTRNATKLPEILLDYHIEAIASGAKKRLMAMPKKEWSDLKLAGYHDQLFEKAKKKEKAERLNDYARSSTLTVRPPSYW